ncbi:MAG: bifunctional diaminohydroxyphosphoribosylaminopyrimidine deaminase/5-amino-6-(5-phosphoribosylamino)uracil reductase RibD [Candidatus Omnitrophica bacterium]|nr:bifunctional diaminohydroxyphosphoribosylaminopyrimidine deaminase/5-amino-6-(5-phosphoribosylamino)uracil reductase RibD [Candidatus Omnitrophota bacterium]
MAPNTDPKYMALAIALAKKAEGMTSPNPIVGAVIVRKGKIVGRGYHKRAGLAHAEINALRQAGAKARGATLYVTLEPCDHFGRTPPCTKAIIKSGINRVVIAMKDPNPINNGNGIRRLNRHGIKTKVGILAKDAFDINRPYIKFITKNIPFVTVKVAQSLDGKIATRSGDSKWISSEKSRRYVHKLREMADAVMVGANTVRRDDPLLLSRSSRDKQPVRVIVSGRSAIPSGAKIFSEKHKYPVIVVRPDARSGKRVDLLKLLKALAKNSITNILVEGGGELIASLLEKKLVDRLLVFIAPKIIGGRDAKTAVEGIGIEKIKDAFSLKNISVKRFKEDILIQAEVQ